MKEKNEYSSKCPSALKNLIQETNKKIEVSIIDSKKLFNFCSRIANKNNFKLPEVHSPRAQDSQISHLMINRKKAICSPRLRLQEITINKKNSSDKGESDDSDFSHQNLSSRVLDKEECQVNYKLINERMRSRIRKTRVNKHMLFTFNPYKLRLKSPAARKESLLM